MKNIEELLNDPESKVFLLKYPASLDINLLKEVESNHFLKNSSILTSKQKLSFVKIPKDLQKNVLKKIKILTENNDNKISVVNKTISGILKLKSEKIRKKKIIKKKVVKKKKK